jgi:glycosyltransferase involved in cell wall biosynthesis
MPNGLNLIGYATSPTGLGEDLRSFAAMLDYLKVPYSIVDVPTESSGKATAPWKYLSTDNYTTSFFFMSPMECARLAEAQPKMFSEPKVKVGYFLWELPDFPKNYLPALNLVDHIWCPTRFVQSAFFDQVKKLILSIPLPVINVPRAGRDIRQELDIPQEAYVVLYMFDVRSTLTRKNPQGTINAFMQFMTKRKDAYLILKINRWQQVDPRLFDWIPTHPNIRIVSETMQDGELADLYEAANVYLSLHRSEGFGRTLVEAMQHGLEVISTSYSGPEDYLEASYASLVDWNTVAVKVGDYPYTEGSAWAEPSISSAVSQLEATYLARDPKRKKRAIKAGREFTVEKLAKKYKPILMNYLKS